MFSYLCAVTGIADFAALCRVVYFPTEDCSDALFLIVNAGLYNVFIEHLSTMNDVAEKELTVQYLDMCKANLETSLVNMPLFLSTKIENVQALLLGVCRHLTCSAPFQTNNRRQ